VIAPEAYPEFDKLLRAAVMDSRAVIGLTRTDR